MPRKTTRNAQGGGTIRQRPDGTWEARYTLGRDPGTGKQIQKSVYGKSQSEVLKKLQATSASLNDGTYMEPSRITVGQWLELWEKEYLGNVKPATVLSYSQHIKNHLLPAFNKIKLAALRTVAIQKLYNDKQRAGMSPKTVKNLHGVLHKALKQAVLLGYLRVNPSDNCVLPRVEKAEMKPMDSPEMETFLKALKGNPCEALLTVDIFTGLRQGELLGLTWDNVDFERGSITLCKQLCRPRTKGDIYRFGSLKNDKPRVINPAPYVMDVLRKHKKEQLIQRVKAGTLWDEGEFLNLVFTNELGGHLIYATVYKHFKRILEAAGIPEKRFHDLRHTYAVSSLRSGDDIKTVQENLGHHTAAFTLDQYGHVTDTMRQASAQRMETFIQSLIKSD